MNMKDAYKQKIEAELKLVQAKIEELKAKSKLYATDVHVKYVEQVEELERKFDATKAKLKELDEAGEEKWEHFKEDVESAWEILSKAVKDAAAQFKK